MIINISKIKTVRMTTIIMAVRKRKAVTIIMLIIVVINIDNKVESGAQ